MMGMYPILPHHASVVLLLTYVKVIDLTLSLYLVGIKTQRVKYIILCMVLMDFPGKSGELLLEVKTDRRLRIEASKIYRRVQA